MGERRARRQHQGREIRPRHFAQIRGDEAGLRGLGDVVGVVVAGDHLGAARLQRVAARKPGAAEAEHRNRLAREGGDGDHGLTSVIPGRAKHESGILEIPDCRCAASGMTTEGMQGDHRSFSVERPASASITEMIQNRITICGSVQPFCSK